jgi:hypothetical protein
LCWLWHLGGVALCGVCDCHCQESMQAACAKNVFRCSVPCTAHKGWSIAKCQHDLCPRVISSMIAFAIAERPVGAVDTLRECASVFLKTHLSIVETMPRLQYGAHRSWLLGWVLRSDDAEAQRRRGVLDFLNGDWLSRVPVHHHSSSCPCACRTKADFDRLSIRKPIVLRSRIYMHIMSQHRPTAASAGSCVRDTLMCRGHWSWACHLVCAVYFVICIHRVSVERGPGLSTHLWCQR